MQLSTLDEFGNRSKMQNIVTKNASNVSKAFTVIVNSTDANKKEEFSTRVAGVDQDSDERQVEVVNVFDVLSGA